MSIKDSGGSQNLKRRKTENIFEKRERKTPNYAEDDHVFSFLRYFIDCL